MMSMHSKYALNLLAHNGQGCPVVTTNRNSDDTTSIGKRFV